MGKYQEQAVNNHRSGHSCSGSVLCAFAAQAGLSEREASSLAAPFAGGRGVKCGAVLAAEEVLKRLGGSAEDFEQEFISRNGSVICRELLSSRNSTCRKCVSDAAGILETLI